MHTLRELGEFVGLGDASPVLPTGVVRRDRVTMRSVGDRLAPVLVAGERTSLRAMILALPRLPPINLEVETDGKLAGEAPILVHFTVHPSPGIILSTALKVLHDGQQQGELLVLQPPDFSTSSAVVSESAVGAYVVNVSRVGVPNTGLVTLEKTFAIFVTAKPTAKPPSAASPPKPPEGKQPTTQTLHSKVALFNCHHGKRVLDIRVRDMTLDSDYRQVAILDAQYDDNGFCPAHGSAPIEIALTDKHWHEIVALDAEMPGCISNPGDAVDPLNANCWREHIVVFGDKNGPVLHVTIA
jgi:hypothetical protein